MAFTDSERLLPKLVDELEPQLKELGLWDEDISIVVSVFLQIDDTLVNHGIAGTVGGHTYSSISGRRRFSSVH